MRIESPAGPVSSASTASFSRSICVAAAATYSISAPDTFENSGIFWSARTFWIGVMIFREKLARKIRGVSPAHLGECHDCLGPYVWVRVFHHLLEHRLPSLRKAHVAAAHHVDSPGAHQSRFVVQQQWGHEVPLVKRFEQVDRVQHSLFLGMREFFEERFHSCEIGNVDPNVCGLECSGFESCSDRLNITVARTQCHAEPHNGHEQRQHAQEGPR